MTDSAEFQLVVGGMISSSSSMYEVQALLGSGSYGDVAQCRKVATNETVALKVLKTGTHKELAKKEMSILKMLKELNCDKYNIIQCNDSFTFGEHFCLEFDKLDMSLRQFLHMRHDQPLSLMEIRPVVQQLATALDFLKRAGIVHADLKPANIMMVNHEQQPLKVRIIDFGLALTNPAAYTGATLQSRWYRAPEIILGAPFNEAIDVWSLGCTVAEMLMNTVLFPGSDNYDMMRHFYYTVGKPTERMLEAGWWAQDFYTLSLTSRAEHHWSFKSALEARKYNLTPRTLNELSDLMRYQVSQDLSGEDLIADKWDRIFFINLLIKTLKVDFAERITPSEILKHPFITMRHLKSFNQSPYVKKCVELMTMRKDVSPKEETSTCTDGSAPHSDPPQGLNDSKHSTIMPAENSPSKKRKRDGEDSTESGKRTPNTAPEKKARTEPKEASQTEAGGKTSPPKSPLQKRKRDDTDGCTNSAFIPPSKKRSVDLSKQLMASVNKLFGGPEAAPPSLTQVGKPQKRKRSREAASDSAGEETSAAKMRRRVAGEEGETC